MMLWPWKKPPPQLIDDIEEARAMRAEAKADLRVAVDTGNVVAQITGYIAERRALNHFGESLEISFAKHRRGHA